MGFCSFFRQKTAKKRLCTRHKKALHFFKTVVLVQGVFAENWSEVSPFVLFLDKKQLKKDYVLGTKKRYIFSKLSFWYRGFLLKIGLKSHLLFFFRQKTAKKRLCTRHKKAFLFFKTVVLIQGVFAENWSEIS